MTMFWLGVVAGAALGYGIAERRASRDRHWNMMATVVLLHAIQDHADNPFVQAAIVPWIHERAGIHGVSDHPAIKKVLQ